MDVFKETPVTLGPGEICETLNEESALRLLKSKYAKNGIEFPFPWTQPMPPKIKMEKEIKVFIYEITKKGSNNYKKSCLEINFRKRIFHLVENSIFFA